MQRIYTVYFHPTPPNCYVPFPGNGGPNGTKSERGQGDTQSRAILTINPQSYLRMACALQVAEENRWETEQRRGRIRVRQVRCLDHGLGEVSLCSLPMCLQIIHKSTFTREKMNANMHVHSRRTRLATPLRTHQLPARSRTQTLQHTYALENPGGASTGKAAGGGETETLRRAQASGGQGQGV